MVGFLGYYNLGHNYSTLDTKAITHKYVNKRMRLCSNNILFIETGGQWAMVCQTMPASFRLLTSMLMWNQKRCLHLLGPLILSLYTLYFLKGTSGYCHHGGTLQFLVRVPGSATLDPRWKASAFLHSKLILLQLFPATWKNRPMLADVRSTSRVSAIRHLSMTPRHTLNRKPDTPL